MTNAFSGTKTDPSKVKDEERDSVGGGSFIWESDTYPVVISEAFPDVSAKGALSLVVIYKNKEGKEITQTEWVQSGNAKGNSATYAVRDNKGKPTGERRKLPGLAKADGLCELVADKTLEEVGENTEKKVVMRWNKDAGGKVEQTVDMLMDLVGKNVIIGVQKIIENKRVKGDDGDYHPTNEIREINEIDKIFDGATGRSLIEIRAQIKDPSFIHTWRDSNRGETINNFTKVAGSTAQTGTPGAPAATQATPPAPTTGLFE